ncbi:MAG: 5-hydroxyisourate hydrolase [Urechidicola sp.]|jgi:5-hydroxyisourate hydrolase
MALITSHTLNSVNGTHAGNIAVELIRICQSGERETLLQTSTDEGGRFSEKLSLSAEECANRYELVFQAGAYFESQDLPLSGVSIMQEVVIRFTMPDPSGQYHIPLMLSPNSYSVWCSS